MEYLEKLDAEDRKNNTPMMRRLRQITPDTGKFISLMFAASPPGTAIEIGTSAGYSSLWLSLVCKAQRRSLTTFEILDEKAAIARETFRSAGVEDCIHLVKGDARGHLGHLSSISFCFLDCEKDAYPDCYNAVIPLMVHGGLLIADNIISHRQELGPFVERVMGDERVDALIVPIGKGELVCRKNVK
jgi:predicted O-methyltransferase YrrM